MTSHDSDTDQQGALRLDILTRVSRTMGREGDSYGSPEIQLKDCRNWIAAQGHVEGEHFHEENVSGGALLTRRPGLQAVIDRMRSGDSDGVVVRAYDRFMRPAGRTSPPCTGTSSATCGRAAG
jgi:DNA invertase Pin-like site-specific DNA recombinase